MNANVGNADRIVRIVVGLGLIAFAVLSKNEYAVWGWIGIVPVLTGIFRVCPAYSLIGLNTCGMKKGA
jgi:Protein of unknown function (DUF2892)